MPSVNLRGKFGCGHSAFASAFRTCEDPSVPALPRFALTALTVIGALASVGAGPHASAHTSMQNAGVGAAKATPYVRLTPVLVELFTSEGCSSCPPADNLLRDLIATQPVEGAFVIGLSEHVDYWNRLGWTDPFSDRAFSERQSAYAAFARSADVYTPQMVVDGRASFVGSNRERALKEIAAAAARAKAAIELQWNDDGDLDVRLGPGSVKANVPIWMSITEDGLTVKVAKGENADRTLIHDGVTRRLDQAGRADRSGAFRQVVPVKLGGAWRVSATHVIVFAQEAGGPITALGTISLRERPAKCRPTVTPGTSTCVGRRSPCWN